VRPQLGRFREALYYHARWADAYELGERFNLGPLVIWSIFFGALHTEVLKPGSIKQYLGHPLIRGVSKWND